MRRAWRGTGLPVAALPGLGSGRHPFSANRLRNGRILLEDLIYRGYIQLDRRIRNRVIARGIFTSSRICRIAGDEVHTHNSIYRVTVIEFPEAAIVEAERAGINKACRLDTRNFRNTSAT